MANTLRQQIIDFLTGAGKSQNDADVYQKAVEARQLQAMGQIHDDPRNDGYTYNGLAAHTPQAASRVNTKPQGVSQSLAQYIQKATPTPTQEPQPAMPQDTAASQTSIPQSNYLETEVLPRTRKYGIPDALAAGQWAAEGRFVEPQNNNWFNLMYNGKVHPYQNLDNQVADYALTIKNLLKNQGADLGNTTDAMQVLKLLQSGNTRFEGHQSDPNNYVNLVSSTPEFKHYYGNK